MPIFTCKIGTSDGRILEKDIEAAGADMLRQSLEDQGFYVFHVKKKPLQFLFDKGVSQRKVDNKTLLSLNQELMVLIKAGLPIIQALDTILERMDRGKLGEVLREIRQDIKGGASLSEAFEKHPSVFPHLYVASIRAGERTGELPQNLRRYSTFLKKAEALRKKVISAMIYPAILVTVAVLAISGLLIYVVPTFSQIYADSGSQLPLMTRMLMGFTGTLKRLFPFLIIGLVITFLTFRKWAATEKGRYAVDDLRLKIPVLGEIWFKYSIATFTRTLANVLASGIPVVTALRMTAGTLNNKVLERRLLEAVLRVEEGTRLSMALEAMKLMPPLALRMLSVGETTGSLEEMLNDISDYFEDEVDARLTVLTTAIEPAIMLFMGLVIGFIVITMYLPVFKIAGTVG